MLKWYETKMTSNTSPAPLVASGKDKYDANYDYYKAFNEATTIWSDSWTSLTVPTYLQLDFGEPKKVNIISIKTWNSTTGDNASPKVFELLGSNDGLNWDIAMSSVTTDNWLYNTEKIFNLKESVNFRYYRINITQSSGATYTSIGLIKFGLALETKMALKNPTTNQHYSLADKTLILLPDGSDKTIIEHGIEAGVEVKLDEVFNKIKTVNSDGTFINGVVEPFSVYDYISETPELIIYNESEDDLTVLTTTEPFSVYDHISENPQAIIYTESTDDITVSTTTEPYDLYDEFGDEVDVLYYTDDETVTEAALKIEANWSPLDELQGEVEVVTWSSDENAQLQLETGGLFKEQIVKLQDYIDVSNLVSVNIAAGTTHAKFLIEKRSEPGMYYSLYEGYFFKCEASEYMIGNYGLTPTAINAITAAQWQAFLGSETHIKLVYLFSNQSIATKSVSTTLDAEHTVGTITVAREIIGTTPSVSTLELTVNMFSPAGRLEEIERINLNNLMELELRTSILMKMPIIKSKQMIIETFDDNDYEIVSAGSKYNTGTKQFEDEFELVLPIEIPSDAGTVTFNSLGQGFSAELTDGTTTKAITFDYSETIDLSPFSNDLLSLSVKGNAGGWIRGVAYAWL